MTGLIGSIVGGPAAWALGALGTVKRGVGAATRSPKSALITLGVLVFVGLLGMILWQNHMLKRRDAQLARWPIIYAQERHSFRIERDSVNTLLAAIRTQNAAVQRMGDEGQRKQLAAASALRQAQARSAHGEVSAARIDQERSERPSQAGCKSGAAVMAARSDL